MINDLLGYVSKKPLSAVLSPVLQPLQIAHIVWHQPAAVLFVVPPSGASVFQAGCRIKRSEGQAEPPVAELGKYPLSSEKRVRIIITRRASTEQLTRTTRSTLWLRVAHAQVMPPVPGDPHIHEVVQADFGAAFLEALPLCRFDLRSPGTTPRSENKDREYQKC